MIQVFKCPSCGATLSYEGGDEASIKCQFCGSTVIVPAELRAKPEPIKPAREAASPTVGDISNLPLEKLAEVKALVNAGNKIEAIKVLREATGLGLKEAKDGVEALERGEPLGLSSMTATTGSALSGFPGFSQLTHLAEVVKLARAGQQAEAIQRYRDIMSVDLETAQSAVEAIASGQPLTMTSVSTGSSTGVDQAAKLVQIAQLAKAGQKIEAIKIFRQTYDVGLKDAKDAVEAIEAGNSPDLAVQRARQAATTTAQAQTQARRRGSSAGCGLFWVVFTIGMVGFVGAMVTGLPFRMSGSFKQALAAAQADPQVIEALGSPVQASWWPITGSLSCGTTSCSANYSATIYGPKGSARLIVQSDSQGGSLFFNEGTWALDATLFTDNNGIIDLTEPPPPTPTLSPAIAEATSGAISRATAIVQATEAMETATAEQESADATATVEAQVTAEAQATTDAQAAIKSIRAVQAKWPVVISETFKNNNRNWPVGPTRDNSLSVDAAVTKGHYAWTVNVKHGNSYFNLIPDNPQAFDTFSAAVDVKMLSGGDGNYTYGLVFRHVKNDYGFFGIQADGSFRVLTVFDSGIYQMIQISSELIKTDPGAVNHIAVSGVGSDFVCVINGQTVYLLHEDFVPGDIGLGIDTLASGSEAKLEFDNFVVQAPK